MSTSLKDLISTLLESIDQHKELQSLDYQTQEMLERAMERVIESTDPKIRLVPGYRRKLSRSILKSLEYAEILINEISQPIDINTNEFVRDPYLRAFFPTLDGLRKVFRQSSELQEYFSEPEHMAERESCALLCMRKSEETVLGKELKGDQVVSDVRQTRVSFSGHRIYSPMETESSARKELKCCIFEGLVVNALEKISALRQRRIQLDTQRQILSTRLRSERRTRADADMHGSSESVLDRQRLSDELAAIETELQQIGYVTPEASLNLVNETLAKPEDFVSLHHLSLSLDRSGIKREELMDTASVNRLELSEVSIKGQPSRVVTLAKIRRNEVEQVSRLSS